MMEAWERAELLRVAKRLRSAQARAEQSALASGHTDPREKVWFQVGWLQSEAEAAAKTLERLAEHEKAATVATAAAG